MEYHNLDETNILFTQTKRSKLIQFQVLKAGITDKAKASGHVDVDQAL